MTAPEPTREAATVPHEAFDPTHPDHLEWVEIEARAFKRGFRAGEDAAREWTEGAIAAEQQRWRLRVTLNVNGRVKAEAERDAAVAALSHVVDSIELHAQNYEGPFADGMRRAAEQVRQDAGVQSNTDQWSSHIDDDLDEPRQPHLELAQLARFHAMHDGVSEHDRARIAQLCNAIEWGEHQ